MDLQLALEFVYLGLGAAVASYLGEAFIAAAMIHLKYDRINLLLAVSALSKRYFNGGYGEAEYYSLCSPIWSVSSVFVTVIRVKATNV